MPELRGADNYDLTALRARIAELLADRAKQVRKLGQVCSRAEAEVRDLNPDEHRRFAELRDEINRLDLVIDGLESRADELEEMGDRNADREELARKMQPNAKPVKVGKEPTAYRADDREVSFFGDLLYVRSGGLMGGYRPGAQERLERHAAEVRAGAHGEQRDVGTGAFGAMVVPSYLPSAYAAVLRAGRVTANLCDIRDLPPEGMTLNIPRGTSGTVVAAQTSENEAVAEGDFDDTDLVVSVRTYAGQQDVSRQAIERGRGVDELIYSDLAADYARLINVDVLNGPGTNGRHTGIIQTSGISTRATNTATVGSIVAQIGAAAAYSMTARYMSPDAIVMHPRRWNWMAAQTDSDGRPQVPMSGDGQSVNSFATGTLNLGRAGTVLGIPVHLDASVPSTATGTTTLMTGSTQDVVLLITRNDLKLWEDGPAPRIFSFQETLGGQLTIKLVAAGYSAFTAGWHPESVVVLNGPGLAAPTF